MSGKITRDRVTSIVNNIINILGIEYDVTVVDYTIHLTELQDSSAHHCTIRVPNNPPQVVNDWLTEQTVIQGGEKYVLDLHEDTSWDDGVICLTVSN